MSRNARFDTSKPVTTVASYKERILLLLSKRGKDCMNESILESKCHTRKGGDANYRVALDSLKKDGIICRKRRGYGLCTAFKYFPGKIVRLSKTFGFAKRDGENAEEIFIPGKYLMGSMPGDRVLLHEIPSRSGKPEGEVIDVLEEAEARLTGIISEEFGEFYLIPDTMSKTPIKIYRRESGDFEVGDKVLAELCFRGHRHSEHKVRILSSFGSSNKAHVCAHSMLALHGITPYFPPEVEQQAAKMSSLTISAKDMDERIDMRDVCIFTIDGADSKDLDDAISIECINEGFLLGVHIADVSHYVKPRTPLDTEAFARGTSIYYANQVIPMLPKQLSNGICSLNPDEDRLAFSAFIKLNKKGEMMSSEFHKTVIRSRVKGVYSEVNEILNNTATADIQKKYSEVIPSLRLIEKLSDLRLQLRKQRGVPEIETPEGKIILDSNNVCVNIVPRTRGKSECIIEEMMLLANEAAAHTAKTRSIPFIFRTHEKPSIEKVENLKHILLRLGLNVPPMENITSKTFADILEENKDSESYPILNTMVLRSMAKASYTTEKIGHFGLALDDYAHFTSPIRRYPDLMIHRILSAWCKTRNAEKIREQFKKNVEQVAQQSSETEIRAVMTERDCESCYKAEYMSKHIGETFTGIVSGVTDYGFYVILPDTVEGLVAASSISEDEYWYNDEGIALKTVNGDKEYRLGSSIKVKCVNTDINSGNIDFIIAG